MRKQKKIPLFNDASFTVNHKTQSCCGRSSVLLGLFTLILETFWRYCSYCVFGGSFTSMLVFCIELKGGFPYFSSVS